MARWRKKQNQKACNIEFTEGKSEYIDGTYFMTITKGTQKQFNYQLENITDFSTWTFTSGIKQIDTPIGVAPEAGAKDKADGEQRSFVEVSKTGDTAKFYISDHLGTDKQNDGTTDVSFNGPGADGVPQFGQDAYYFFYFIANNGLTGEDKIRQEINGIITLKNSNSD